MIPKQRAPGSGAFSLGLRAKVNNTLPAPHNLLIFHKPPARANMRHSYLSVSFNSIRRFCARASGLLPEATG